MTEVMIKKCALKMIFFVILLSFIPAAYSEQANIRFNLKDITTTHELKDVMIFLSVFEGGSGDLAYEGVFNINKSLNIALENGSYKVIILADSIGTEGRDYFREEHIYLRDVSRSIQDIFLFPVGSLRGVVKDKFDNIAGYAELKFDCLDDIGISFPDTASKFGSFKADIMPVGRCKIFATYGDAVGFQEVSIERGGLVDIEIRLDKGIARSGPKPGRELYYLPILLPILFLMVILLALSYLRIRKKKALRNHPGHSKISKISKKKKGMKSGNIAGKGVGESRLPDKQKMKEATKEAEKEDRDKVQHIVEGVTAQGGRAKDIMVTLNANEKSVVSFLLKGKGEGTQAGIRHGTMIPRTSLARVLESLSSKKIIDVEREGKAVRVRLTSWFLERN